MKNRNLGRTNISVSEIGFGSWGIGGESRILGYGPTHDERSRSALSKAIELGCNFFETADCYGEGRSEGILGTVLSSNRPNYTIATKAGFDFYHHIPGYNFHPYYIRFAIIQSLKRLKSDYIDVFLLHNPSSNILYYHELIKELLRLKKEGILRSIGVSVNNIDSAIQACNTDWVEVIEIAYNMLQSEAEILIFPLANIKGIGIIAREILANGFLTGKFKEGSFKFADSDIRLYWSINDKESIIRQIERLKPYCKNGESLAQLAIRFVLESKAISTAICGCKTVSQVEENFT